jgi:2-oxoisovalerate dehydrogenase E1 component alpha subunit
MSNAAVSNSSVSHSKDSTSTHSESCASTNSSKSSTSSSKSSTNSNKTSTVQKESDSSRLLPEFKAPIQVDETHQLTFITTENLRIPTLKILQENGVEFEDAMDVSLNKDVALRSYKAMQYIRVLDERMVAAQRQGRLSFYITCTGEEASVVGSAAALQPTDMIMGQYREQAALRYRGFTTEQFMGQLLGNEMDLGKGRQMPVHYGSKELHYMTISSPLATQIPQAAGYAYGQKLAGKGECTLCYFGEGAASEGDFHAGLNMAAVQNAPVIFVCRNNGYAISTPTEEQYRGDGIASRGVGYGIKTIRVDGNDLLAVYTATVAAREFAVSNSEPVLIECMTYRLGGHSTSDDPSGYRGKDEEDEWKTKDPINRFKHWLLSKNWWSADDDSVLLEEYRTEVLDVLKKVEKMPLQPLRTLITDVYEQPSSQLEAQLNELEEHLRQYPEHYPASAGRL